MSASQEFKQKLKQTVKEQMGVALYNAFGFDLMIDQQVEVIIAWLRKNKNLVQKLLNQ